MTLKLYTNKSDPISINKSLTLLNTLSVELWQNESPLELSIFLDNTTGVSNCNYAEFNGKYYFVTPEKTQGNRYILHLTEDTLYTWRSALASAEVTATRSNFKNDNVKDNLILDIPKETVQYRQLSGELTGESYIMIVGGY